MLRNVDDERSWPRRGAGVSEELTIRAAGDRHYRAWVGPPERYDLKSAEQFGVLTVMLGMREHHHLLDVGCGSLRLGRLCLIYLQANHYFGIDPEAWVIDEGIQAELGRQIIELKRPSFSNNSDFDFTVFGRTFDYIMAQSIFTHAALWQVEACIANSKKVLSPAGFFIFNYVVGETDSDSREWTYPGCVKFRKDTVRRIVSDNGMHSCDIQCPFNLQLSGRWTVISPSRQALEQLPHQIA